MRKLLLAPLALCAVVLISVLYLPAVSAKILRSDQTIVWTYRPCRDPDPRLANSLPDIIIVTPENPEGIPCWGYWMGLVNFGPGMTGTAYFATDPTVTPTNLGKKAAAVHFYEYFYIAFDNGGWILGHDNGVYLMNSPSVNWVYMANGWVTDGSSNYADLIGCYYFEQGMTDYPFGEETTGIGFCFLC